MDSKSEGLEELKNANSLTLGVRGTHLHTQGYHRVVSLYSAYYMSHQENFKFSQLLQVPFMRNLITHYDALNLRSEIGPILDTFLVKMIQTGNNTHQRFEKPFKSLWKVMCLPITKILKPIRKFEGELGPMDLTTAAKFSFDINIRRFTEASMMTQLKLKDS
jgi:hypothetical protein